MDDPTRQRPHETFSFDGEYGAAYQDLSRRVIPAYDQLFEMAYALLHGVVGDEANILVVGCGPGVEMVTLGSHAPGWSFVALDPSPVMLDFAFDAVSSAGFEERVDFQRGYVQDVQATGFDGVTVFNVMHFLEDDGPKLELLSGVRERLRDGGRMVMVDLHGEPGTPGFADTMDVWERFMSIRGLVGDAREKFRQRLDEGMKWNPAERTEALLREAGFARYERFFQALFYGGWTADR